MQCLRHCHLISRAICLPNQAKDDTNQTSKPTIIYKNRNKWKILTTYEAWTCHWSYLFHCTQGMDSLCKTGILKGIWTGLTTTKLLSVLLVFNYIYLNTNENTPHQTCNKTFKKKIGTVDIQFTQLRMRMHDI